jgi:hypothetical protein
MDALWSVVLVESVRVVPSFVMSGWEPMFALEPCPVIDVRVCPIRFLSTHVQEK